MKFGLNLCDFNSYKDKIIVKNFEILVANLFKFLKEK
jgi:hypothetical protein